MRCALGLLLCGTDALVKKLDNFYSPIRRRPGGLNLEAFDEHD